MGWRSMVTVAVVVGAVAFTAGRVWSQDAQGPKMPTPEELAKMMAELAAPAEQHKALTSRAGAWDSETTMWMDPSGPPTVSKSSSKVTSICNGLYTLEEHTGEFMGKPFAGFGIHGWSKEKKQYVSFWCDNVSSTPEVMTGTADATGKVVTYEGTPMTCMMGEYTPRWVVSYDDADHVTFQHMSKMAGMADFVKEVEVKSTRRK